MSTARTSTVKSVAAKPAKGASAAAQERKAKPGVAAAVTAKPPSGRGVKDISAARLAQLNAGAPATTLTECLAVDYAALMQAVAPEAGPDAIDTMRAQAATGISKRMALAAQLLADALGPDCAARLAAHASDTVRGWACFVIGALPDLTPAARLQRIRPLADDAHFGVREWAWLAVRPPLAAQLEASVEALAPWTREPSPRLRRYASECLRPRGVWCAHIAALKADPAIALPLLEPLRADPDVYVQDSVANWLNDASKDQPGWVREICARWLAGAPPAATVRICQRALRSIGG